MRLILLTALAGLAARAETQTFTGTFASRLSFFSMNSRATYEVSLDEPASHCRTPCSLGAHVGEAQFSVTRDGFTTTETRVLAPGETWVAIRSYSPSLLIAGTTLMSISATALTTAAIFLVVIPLWGPLVLLVLLGPIALLTGVPGVVLTALAPRRQTLQMYRGEFQVP